MADEATRQAIREHLRKLEAQEVRIYELGTPQIEENGELRALAAMGRAVIPDLLELAETESPKVVAYIIAVLRRVGGPEALEAVRKLRPKYAAKPDKNEWDYAVLGQCNVALGELEK